MFGNSSFGGSPLGSLSGSGVSIPAAPNPPPVVTPSGNTPPPATISAIGYNDTRISYTPRSTYSWFLYSNGQLFADITGITEDRKFSQTRNDSDQISFSVSVDKVNDLASRLHINPFDMLDAGSTEVRLVRGGVVLVAGELGPFNKNVGGDRKYKMQAAGWFDLLKQRLTSDEFVGTNTSLAISLSLFSTTLARPFGNAGNYAGFQIGITPSPDPTHDPTTRYTDKSYDKKTLYDVITEFSNEVNGFDFEMTWDKRLNIYYPHIGVPRPDIVFTYPFGNVKDIQTSVDPTKMFNSLLARGKGSGANQLEITVSASDQIKQKYGLRENVMDYTNIEDQTLLTNTAQADQNIYQQPLVIQKIQFDGSGRVNAPKVGTFHIGDLVKVYNTESPYPNTGQYYMIDKIEVVIGPDDSEDVTITVAVPNLPANRA